SIRPTSSACASSASSVAAGPRTGNRATAGSGHAEEHELEAQPLAHGQWRELPVAESVAECRHGPPAGAVTGCDDFEVEPFQGIDRVRDDALVGAGKMQPAQHAMELRAGKAVAGMA